jgi:hypothetical protein
MNLSDHAIDQWNTFRSHLIEISINIWDEEYRFLWGSIPYNGTYLVNLGYNTFKAFRGRRHEMVVE